MALKNAFGGLGLDATIQRLIERLLGPDKEPLFVAGQMGGPVPIEGAVGLRADARINATVRTVAAATGVKLIANDNLNRTGLSIYNGSTSEILYILAANLGPNLTVSSTAYTIPLQVSDYWELPQGWNGCYKGIVTAVWATGSSGTAYVTEYSL